MTLQNLIVGERFYPRSQQNKNTPIFEVVDIYDGKSRKIKCKNLLTGGICHKLAGLDVIVTRSYR